MTKRHSLFLYLFSAFMLTTLLASPNITSATIPTPTPTPTQPYCASFATVKSFIDNDPTCYQTPCDATQCVDNTLGSPPGIWSQLGTYTNNVQVSGYFNSNADYQCVELAHRYFHFAFKIDLPQADGGDLCAKVPTSPQANLMTVCTFPASLLDPNCMHVPMHGDLMIYAKAPPQLCPYTNSKGQQQMDPMCHGHVAVVDNVIVNSNRSMDQVSLIEENWHTPQAHPGARVDLMANALCWIHANTNHGTCNGFSGIAANGQIPPPGSGYSWDFTCRSATCKPEPLAHALFRSGLFQTGPSVVINAASGLEAFVRDAYGQMEHQWQNVSGTSSNGTPIISGWQSSWQPMGGALNSDPIVVTRDLINTTGGGGGDLDVYYIGPDYTVCHTHQMPIGNTGGSLWSAQFSIFAPETGINGIGGNDTCGAVMPPPGTVAAGGQVSPLYNPANRTVQVFFPGADQSLLTAVQQSYNGTWSRPVPILPANSISSDIKVIQNNGLTYLLYHGIDKQGNDGVLQGLVSPSPATPGTWTPLPDLTGPRAVTSNIAAARDPNSGGLAIFYRGVDHAIWALIPPSAASPCQPNATPIVGSTGVWCPAVSIGGRDDSDLSTEYLPGGQIRIIYKATDGGIYYVEQTPPTGGTSVGRFTKHVHLLGTSVASNCNLNAPTQSNPGANASVALMAKTVYSNIAAVRDADGREEVFFIGDDPKQQTQPLVHAWELTVPTLNTPCTQWSGLASLDGNFPECSDILAGTSTSGSR